MGARNEYTGGKQQEEAAELFLVNPDGLKIKLLIRKICPTMSRFLVKDSFRIYAFHTPNH